MFVGAVGNQTDFGMILHFLSDDKFSDYVVGQFSEPEMHSEFVLMSDSETTKYFRNVDIVARVNPYKKGEMGQLLDSLKDYSAIILHGLFYPWCETVLRNVPDNVKVVWSFWGGDLFGRKDLFKEYLAPRTKFVFNLHETLNKLKGKKNSVDYELPMDLFRRIDFFNTDMQKEWEFAKQYCHNPLMQYHWYNYYSIEETLGELRGRQLCGDNIIIGNSATIECNYFDIVGRVEKSSIKGRNVIAPLSYGSPWVKNLVLKYGMFRFGKSFKPLVRLIPLDEYNEMLLSCSIMIQPHYRSQAQGNIITGLWLGMRVYLSERSCAYSYFKGLGAAVFSIEKDLKRGNHEAFSKLPQTDVEKNRKVLLHWYGKDAMYRKNLDLVKLISQ